MNKELKEAANSKEGAIIISYLKKVIDDELDANDLVIKEISDELIGQETRAILEARRFLQKQIKLLIEPEPQNIPDAQY